MIYLLFGCLLFISIEGRAEDSSLIDIYLNRAKLYYNYGEIENAIKEAKLVLSLDKDNREAKALLEEINTKFSSTQTLSLDPIRKFGQQGFGERQLSNSITIAVDEDDNLYVADGLNHNIQKFSSDGKFILSFSRGGRKKDDFYRPSAIAYWKGKLYISDEFKHQINFYDLNGNPLREFGRIDKPTGITIDKSGYIYVVDPSQKVIRKYKDNGDFMGELGAGRLSAPQGILITDKGDIWIADGKNGIVVLSPEGRFIKAIKENLKEPLSLAEDNEGNILVVDSNLGDILSFDQKGNLLTQYYLGGELTLPTSIVISPQNIVYIAQQGSERIGEFRHRYARSKEEHLALGERRLDEANYSLAIPEFEKAIKLGMDTSKVHFFLGRAYQEERQYKEAVSEYNKAIELRPLAEYYFYRGNAYYSQRKYEQAINDFEQSLSLDPSNINVRNNLGYAYYQVGRLDEALKLFAQILIENPKYVDAKIGEGIVYHKQGDYNKALATYAEVLTIDPNNLVVHHYLGLTYYALEDYDRAISELKRAASTGPYFVDSLYNLGIAYKAIGDKEEAIYRLKKALELAPDREDIKKALEELE